MNRINVTILFLLILNFYNLEVFAKYIKNETEYNTNNKINKNSIIKPIYYKKDIQIEINKFIDILIANVEKEKTNPENKIKDINIESDTQLRTNDKFIAKGDVIVRTNNAVLKANKLVYNSKLKTLLIQGEINFKIEDQFLSASEIQYDFNTKKGLILKAYGSINFKTLGSLKIESGGGEQNNRIELNEKDKFINNVSFNNSYNLGLNNINLKKDENTSFFKRITSQKIKLDLNDLQKWRFQADKIIIDNQKWFSDELFLTNDPYNNPQVKIKNSDFVSINKDEQIYIKAKWSTLILDDKLNIPIGPRRIKVGEENQKLRWELGYDQKKKDGLYIMRSADPIYFLNKNTKLNLKKEFYLQRALQGQTKSFTKKNESLYSAKIRQNNKLSDLFGLEAALESKVYGLNFDSNIAFNSLDLNKLNQTLTSKNELSRTLFEENRPDFSKSNKLSLFFNYRENIWNGSIGEREILRAYGLKINKTNNWKNNKTNKSSEIALAYGNYKANKKNILKEIINRDRLNIFLERNHSYPIWERGETNLINKEYIYSPSVIKEGLRLNWKTKFDFYRYSDDNFQNLFTFKFGPELTLGEFKKKYFDYTKLSIYPRITFAEGNSPFDFDQAVDNKIIELSYLQQITGPLTIKISSQYNFDVDSSKNNQFSNFKYELAWNRRAYNLSAYYNQDQKTGGINFKIYSFNFNGLGSRF